MQLAELRKRVLARCRRAGSSFDNEEVDYAIQAALHEMDLQTFFAYSTTSALSLTINNPEVDVSSLTSSNDDAFSPDRVIRAELAFTDQGTWATGQSYSVNDMVKGDGDPDAKYYVCVEAHTSSSSNEPGTASDSVWELTLSRRGDRIMLTDYATVARALGDGPHLRQHLPDDYVFDTEATGAFGKPRIGAWRDQDTLVVYPVPDVSTYKILFIQKQAVADWTTGVGSNVDIDVPRKILLPAIHGMCWYLDPDHGQAARWEQLFRRHVMDVDGQTIVDAGENPMKDHTAYEDHTDAFDRLYGGF